MAKKRNQRTSQDTLRSLESDLIRAMSGATEEQVAQTIQRVQESGAERPGANVSAMPIEQQMQTRANEALATRAISGGTEADVAAAISAFTPTVTQQPAGEEAGAGGGAGAGAGTGGGTRGGQIGQAFVASDGKRFTDVNSYNLYQQALDRQKIADERAESQRKSAFDLLREEFNRYGLGFLVEDSIALAKSGVSEQEYSIRLRNLPAYKTRFGANAQREAAGLAALTPAEYLALEDAYQGTMRRYGLPKSFYEKTGIGNQPELDNLIAADVSPAELEDRVQLAVERVNNASPEVLRSLEDFYPGISKANIVAYVLDPQRALPLIQRQIRAAEIGGEAMRAGLRTGVQRAEELERMGVTQAQAREGFQTVAEVAPRGSQLAEFYGESPYTQEVAEAEVFGTAGATEARRRRERLVGRERAEFAGSSGTFQGALARDRAGAI